MPHCPRGKCGLPPGQAMQPRGEMGGKFPMRIARLPHVHLLDHYYYLKTFSMASPTGCLGPALPGRHCLPPARWP